MAWASAPSRCRCILLRPSLRGDGCSRGAIDLVHAAFALGRCTRGPQHFAHSRAGQECYDVFLRALPCSSGVDAHSDGRRRMALWQRWLLWYGGCWMACWCIDSRSVSFCAGLLVPCVLLHAAHGHRPRLLRQPLPPVVAGWFRRHLHPAGSPPADLRLPGQLSDFPHADFSGDRCSPGHMELDTWG